MISIKILEEPLIEKEKIHKGALVASSPDDLCKELPEIKDYYFLIERKGWEGINDSNFADIKLVEDTSTWKETKRKFPSVILLDLAGGDFVDVDCFRPLGIPKDYEGIQISAWQRFKRPKLFVQAASLMPKRRFVKFGHFFSNGEDLEETLLKENIINMSKKLEANIDFPYGGLRTNEGLPNDSEAINHWINRARMGILTTKVEGVNRFKMECLAAGIPILVPADVSYPTLKHMNEQTGVVFKPTPEGLAKSIYEVLSNLNRFRPREYVLETTGSKNSIRKLKDALREVSEREGQKYHFDDITYDGRNQSLMWDRKAIKYMQNRLEGIKNGRYNY